MAKVHGSAGDMSVGATSLVVKKWSSDLEQDVIDTSNKASGGWREKELGLKQMTGTFEADLDTAIHATGNFPFPFSSAAAAMVLSMNDGSNDGGEFTFSGIISKISFDSVVEGILTISGSWESTGAVIYTAPTP